jgi:signal transduction histidine kinase
MSASPAPPNDLVARASRSCGKHPIAGDPGPALALWPLVAAWVALWLLLTVVALQDYLREEATGLWRPLVWEGSSCLVASAMLALGWRAVARLDALLSRPAAWFARVLAWLPVAAPLFVALVFALRHVVHAALGDPYRHEPWSQVVPYEIAKFAMFYGLIVAVVFGLRSYASMTRHRLAAEQALAQARHAQLMQLAQQIEPHFLFNALGTITETIHTDPRLADHLLTRLAALMRAATDLARRPEVTLDDELRLLQGYTDIMGERFSDRVVVRYDVDPTLRDCRVPVLLMQPLLENVFRHGVEKRTGQARIEISVQRDGDDGLRIEVSDDIGQLAAAPTFGTGLSTLEQRLASRYGTDASLSLHARPAGGVLARIRMPCVR